MKAAFGAESGVVLDVIHSGAAPAAFAATHPAGNAGAVTPSKFSFTPHPGVGVGPTGVGDGDAVGGGVGVHPTHGVGVGPQAPLIVSVSIPMKSEFTPLGPPFSTK